MSTDNNYRYPGSRPFMDTDHDRSIFFGRTEEIQELFYKISAHDLLVLFSKPGLGKTSLLNTGVMQKLREKDFVPFTIRLNDTSIPPIKSVYDAIDNTLMPIEINDQDDKEPENTKEQFRRYIKNGVMWEIWNGDRTRLWTYFKTAETWVDDTKLTPVLIFDQFEELFTLAHSSENKKKFIIQLSELLSKRMPEVLREQEEKQSAAVPRYTETRPEVKIVIVIREDYLAYLEEMSSKVPNILNNRYRLLPMTSDKAEEAIVKPAKLPKEEGFVSTTFQYELEAIKAMLEFLCTHHEDEVEPFQLQLLCSHLETKIKQTGKKCINKDDLGGNSGMQEVLEEFYDSQIRAMGTCFKQRKLRKLCEDGLINAADKRLRLEQLYIKSKYKIPKKDLDKLVKTRLLRSEPRFKSRYYELSHDNLVKPIRNFQKKHSKKNTNIMWMTVLVLSLLITIGSFTAYWKFQNTELDNLYIKLNTQIDNRDFRNAQETYRILLEKDNKSSTPYILLGKGFKEGIFRMDEAIRIFEEAIKNKIENAEIYYELADAYKNQGKFIEAKNYFEKAIEIKKTLSLPYVGLGDVYAKREDYEKAIDYYEKAISVDLEANSVSIKSAKAYIQLAALYIKQDKPEMALEVYKKAIDASIELAYIYENIAEEFQRKRRLRDYLNKLYDIAADISSDSTDYFNELGNALKKQGRYTEAIEQYKKAIKINPENKNAYNNLGGIFSYYLEKYKEAIKQYEIAINIDPEYKDAYYNLGVAFANLGKYTEAIEQYKKVINIDPGFKAAYYNLGIIFAKLKKYDEAIKQYKKVINIDPGFKAAYYNLGAVFGNLEKYTEAIEQYKQVIRIDPEFIYAKTNMAELYLISGDFVNAEKISNNVLNKKDISPYRILAMQTVSFISLLMQDNTERALEIINKLITYYKSLDKDYDYTTGWNYGKLRDFIKNNRRLSIDQNKIMSALIEILESPDSDRNKNTHHLELLIENYKTIKAEKTT
jgi:tetratricopeptide (TPR) repeat protein